MEIFSSRPDAAVDHWFSSMRAHPPSARLFRGYHEWLLRNPNVGSDWHERHSRWRGILRRHARSMDEVIVANDPSHSEDYATYYDRIIAREQERAAAQRRRVISARRFR